MNKVDAIVPKEHKVLVIYASVLATSKNWWGFHCNNIREWDEVSTTLRFIFQQSRGWKPFLWYKCSSNPHQHVKDL